MATLGTAERACLESRLRGVIWTAIIPNAITENIVSMAVAPSTLSTQELFAVIWNSLQQNVVTCQLHISYHVQERIAQMNESKS